MNTTTPQEAEADNVLSLQSPDSVVESIRNTDQTAVSQKRIVPAVQSAEPIIEYNGAHVMNGDLDPDDPRIVWRLQGLADLIIDLYFEDLKCKQQ